jgi:hypothetical protein
MTLCLVNTSDSEGRACAGWLELLLAKPSSNARDESEPAAEDGRRSEAPSSAPVEKRLKCFRFDLMPNNDLQNETSF